MTFDFKTKGIIGFSVKMSTILYKQIFFQKFDPGTLDYMKFDKDLRVEKL